MRERCLYLCRSKMCRICVGCMPLCVVTMTAVCVICSGVLLWIQLKIRLDMDSLRQRISSVEASNKGMPEELHEIHTKMNGLGKDYTLIKQNISKLNKDVAKINKQIADLKTTSNDIKKSIAAAPVIKNLPEDVMKLSENVATIGSKITNVEDKLEKLKTQHSDFDQKHKSFTAAIKQVQDKVSGLNAHVTVKPKMPADNNAINQLHQNIQALEKEFTDLNSTLTGEIKSVSSDTSLLTEQVRILSIRVNSSRNVTQAEGGLANKTGSEASSKNSSLTFEEFVERFANTCSTFECFKNVNSNIMHLNASILDLQRSEGNLTARIDLALDLISQLSSHHLEDSSTTEIVSEAALSATTSKTTANFIEETASTSSSKSNDSKKLKSSAKFTSPGG